MLRPLTSRLLSANALHRHCPSLQSAPVSSQFLRASRLHASTSVAASNVASGSDGDPPGDTALPHANAKTWYHPSKNPNTNAWQDRTQATARHVDAGFKLAGYGKKEGAFPWRVQEVAVVLSGIIGGGGVLVYQTWGKQWWLDLDNTAQKQPEMTADSQLMSDFLEDRDKRKGVTKNPSGLLYKVIKRGKGKDHPGVCSTCLVHYRAASITGKVFDDSYSKGGPSEMRPEQVVRGFCEGLMMMVEGDQLELYVPPNLGYGDQGIPGRVPAGSCLVFQVELLRIKEGERIPRQDAAAEPVTRVAAT